MLSILANLFRSWSGGSSSGNDVLVIGNVQLYSAITFNNAQLYFPITIDDAQCEAEIQFTGGSMSVAVTIDNVQLFG